ncbi:glycosyltransferase [Gramella sp. MT6]|uniref:glycosyltransferase n=1 Tax=Gramella sp. MT6 TaxID=2705471 RepID=UPI001C5D4A82|nr:glycosyltransferase [Gramella sp. MT6]QYA26032.1 glycosyltransferase [Gramella sp. MT6]
MDSKPLVSICIITYNQENYIEECLKGAINQNFNGKFEIVIGEDNSTDKTGQICKEFSLKYPNRVRLLKRAENLGVMKNFISTLMSCKGNYIAVCEGDDYWTDNYKLQRQFDVMEKNPSIDLSFHQCDLLDSGKTPPIIKTKQFPKYENMEVVGLHDVISGGGGLIPMASIFFRTTIMEHYLKYVGNYSGGHYLLQVIGSLNGAIFLKQNMAVYRVNSSTSVIKNVKNNSANYESWIDNHIKKLEDFKSITGPKYSNLINSLILKEKMKAFRSFKTSKEYRDDLFKELTYNRSITYVDFIKFYLIFKNENIERFAEKIYRLIKR